MTLVEFINKYNGKWVEFYDKTSLNQCKDLWGAYNNEVLHYPYITGNANVMHQKMLASGNWVQVSSPRNGDVATWSFGKYGHIAIYYDGYYFSQNLPLGSNSHFERISNYKLIGWVRPKALEGGGMTVEELANDLRKTQEQLGTAIKVLRGDMESGFAEVNKKIAESQTCDCSGKEVEINVVGKIK